MLENETVWLSLQFFPLYYKQATTMKKKQAWLLFFLHINTFQPPSHSSLSHKPCTWPHLFYHPFPISIFCLFPLNLHLCYYVFLEWSLPYKLQHSLKTCLNLPSAMVFFLFLLTRDDQLALPSPWNIYCLYHSLNTLHTAFTFQYFKWLEDWSPVIYLCASQSA